MFGTFLTNVVLKPGLRALATGGVNPKVEYVLQLHRPPRSTELTQGPTSVIAVHGLNPKNKDPKLHAWETWTSKSRIRKDGEKKGDLWLQEQLPNSFPEARMWLYQYDSSIFANKPSLVEAANEFLDKILGIRRTVGLPLLVPNFVFYDGLALAHGTENSRIRTPCR